MQYRADPANAFLKVDLDSLTALYHRRSGATHLVGAPVPELLELLGQGAFDLPGLLAVLGIDDGAEARALLQARLDELVEAGLVFRA